VEGFIVIDRLQSRREHLHLSVYSVRFANLPYS